MIFQWQKYVHVKQKRKGSKTLFQSKITCYKKFSTFRRHPYELGLNFNYEKSYSGFKYINEVISEKYPSSIYFITNILILKTTFTSTIKSDLYIIHFNIFKTSKIYSPVNGGLKQVLNRKVWKLNRHFYFMIWLT